jgi:hypothetical protein
MKFCSVKIYEPRWRILFCCDTQVFLNMLVSTSSKFQTGKYLTGAFPVQSGLKQGDALSPEHFNFPLEYTIRKVQGTRKEWNRMSKSGTCLSRLR